MNASSAMVPSPQAGPPAHDYGAYISRAISIFTGDIGKWAVIGLVGALVFGVGAWGGWYYCAAKALRGENVSIGDVFHPFSRIVSFLALPLLMFGACVALGILGFILAQIGLRILIVPLVLLMPLAVLVAMLALVWTYPLMADRGIGFRDAANLSIEAFKANTGSQIITALVAGVVFVAGLVPFALASPIGVLFVMLAYRCVFYAEGAGAAIAQPAAAPQQGWGQPAAPAAAPQQAWGQPQAPATTAPAPQQAWGQPQAQAPAAAPAATPQQDWGQPAAPAPSLDPSMPEAPIANEGAPLQASAILGSSDAPPTELPQEEDSLETATQSTSVNPDEQFRGKTMAMSAADFEALLQQQQNKK